jgi:hypothetical protein
MAHICSSLLLTGGGTLASENLRPAWATQLLSISQTNLTDSLKGINAFTLPPTQKQHHINVISPLTEENNHDELTRRSPIRILSTEKE